MSRNQLFVLAGGLAVAGVACLLLGISLLSDVRSYVGKNYAQYSTGASGTRYSCDGSPTAVAAKLAAEKRPQARATDRGTEYLRYDDYIVAVGPDGSRPCSIRIENLAAGYHHGSYIHLGPGFTPGSPSGSSGGSPGGPYGDAK
ncbi:DUF4247 domain-containing protein [Mycobacterium sp. TNTM28]|uniref:DUF4247 domain-containing protein n=1 Tax=[Mycobacterium] fortunisiensis TaxID=2600579 RepID=A0ABS6KLG0_9MYCO|nr:DUF4247 domain-containing protein [[Mycobacterium] fortunisiensis]MBU9764401.1 DUF4247 domain-containing protein [[Mycobacterium] fortunisiensis]